MSCLTAADTPTSAIGRGTKPKRSPLSASCVARRPPSNPSLWASRQSGAPLQPGEDSHTARGCAQTLPVIARGSRRSAHLYLSPLRCANARHRYSDAHRIDSRTTDGSTATSTSLRSAIPTVVYVSARPTRGRSCLWCRLLFHGRIPNSESYATTSPLRQPCLFGRPNRPPSTRHTDQSDRSIAIVKTLTASD